MERIYQGVMINKKEVLTLFPYVLGTPSYLETFSNISSLRDIHVLIGSWLQPIENGPEIKI